LVTSADIHLVLANMHTSRNIGALLVDANQHLTCFITETLALHRREVVLEDVVADLGNSSAHNLVVVELSLGRDLTEDHDHVILASRFARYLAVWVRSQTRIKNSVRYLIAEFVRMTLVNGL